MKITATVLFLIVFGGAQAQPAYYDVLSGQGYGYRFFSSDWYKISAGGGTEYTYGAVTDLSIKTSMSPSASYPNRGWTWGEYGIAPVVAIGVQGNMQIAGSFKANGAATIGTTATPSAYTKLNVVGGALEISGAPHQADASLHISTSFGQYGRLTQIGPSAVNSPGLNLMCSLDAAGSANWWSWGVLTSGAWALQPSTSFGGSTGLFIDRSGNMGIGNSAPDAKLAVTGQVHATEVKVTITVPGPDYVFDKSYDLPTLGEVQSYIDQNKHLPEVPSAAEMEKNGIKLGEMNMMLLKKVEELTLYVIEQDKQISSLSTENSELSAAIKSIAEQIKALKK